MNKKGLIGLIAGGIVLVCVFFVLGLLLVKLLWAWTVPDLCPGAVEQGLVAGSISWLTAMKIAIFIAVLGGFSRGCRYRRQTPEGGKTEIGVASQ